MNVTLHREELEAKVAPNCCWQPETWRSACLRFQPTNVTGDAMALYSEQDTSKVCRCFPSQQPPPRRLAAAWRPDVLDLIHKAFVATHDEGDRTFIDKLCYRLSRTLGGVFTFCAPGAI